VNEKINAVKCAGVQMGAIETTTRESLAYPENIVDEYVQMGFHSISLRALTPLGCAHKRWEEIGYQPAEFLTFYRKAFDHIIEINQSGYRLTEGIATIFLKKIIEGIALNYMELRSPCGAAMGQIAYYYNGNVYTCDEGRMIAEMGNDTFLLGTVESTYNELMGTKVCRAACTSSILEALLSCSDCVYQPYCGVCPAVNYALYGDLYEKTSGNYRCQIYRGMLDIIFEKLQEDDYSVRQIFRSWIS
jgi:radical SAM protein with 4Fe4S-binding SPASM domain